MLAHPGKPRKQRKPGPIYEGLQRLFDRWPDAVIMVDRDGRISAVNSAAERIFGYSKNQFEQLSVEDLIPSSIRSSHRKRREGYAGAPRPRAMAFGTSFECERNDGSTFIAQVNLEPIEVDGETMTWAIVRDVSSENQADSDEDNERKSLIGIGQRLSTVVTDPGQICSIVKARQSVPGRR